MSAPPTESAEDLFENAPCGYVSTEPSGRIFKVNATLAGWIGRDAGSLVGSRFQDLLNIAGRIYYETHFAPLLRMQGFFNEVALDLVRNDGRLLPVLVNAVEKRSESGELQFVRITIFNATDRRRFERELLAARAATETANKALRELNESLEKRVAESVAERLKAEAALHQSQKMEALGQLTGGIAHDFNNMLAVVIAGLNLAERQLAKGEDATRFLHGALDAARRAASLTHRLLAFSRLQPLHPQPTDINRLVASMSEILERTLGGSTRLETALADGLWQANVDGAQLESAILNLAINARDAMSNGGKLTVETANCELDQEWTRTHADVKPGQYVMIAVSDTGTGMSLEVQQKAFEPFFTTKESGKGTGLGLSQVHGFVKQSNGHIKIDSEPGRGTTIKVYLPRLEASVADAADRVRPAIPRGSLSEVVLVVEDEERMRVMSVAALRELGFTALDADSGAAALQMLERRPDVKLLFTDMAMPDMDGQLLATKALQMRPDLKVLVTTGSVDGAPNAGADFIEKPFTVEELGIKVREVLSRATGQ